ncbi:MAG: protein kinase [Deltaproteobacteria bacterium]|nr:protein kinase [Deltaproteobacteria bacterium]
MANSTLQGISTPAALRAGQIVAGRFTLEAAVASFGPLVVYTARDGKTQKIVSVWAAPAGLVRPEVSASVRSGIRSASTLRIADSLSVFGISVDPGSSALLVATEELPPRSLADVITEKNKAGERLSLDEAYTALVPVLDALQIAHAQNVIHGAIAPSLIRLTESGRTKLSGLGYGQLLLATRDIPAAVVAPEVTTGLLATPRSDVYAIGATLYELCTGKPFDREIAATSLVPALPITFDVIIENCTAESSDERFQSLSSLRAALAALVAPPENTKGRPAPPRSTDDELGIDVDFEAPVAAEQGVEIEIDTSALHALPALQPFENARPSMVGDTSSMGRSLNSDANEAPNWMFVRKGLDHGPLTAKELVEAIERHEVFDEDIVFNMDTGDRKKLYEWPQFAEFTESAREVRKRTQHAHEVKSAIAEDTVNARAKSLVAASTVVAFAILFGVYWKTLGPGSAARRRGELDIPRPNAHAVSGSLEVLPPPPPDEVRRARSSGGGGGGGGFTSYETAMSAPIEFNMTGGVATGTLNDREIVGPLNANLARFGSCAAQGAPGSVRVRIAVGSAGAPIGVSVLSGSPAFKSCVVGVVRSLRWRAFGGPRVGFAWGFSVE